MTIIQEQVETESPRKTPKQTGRNISNESVDGPSVENDLSKQMSSLKRPSKLKEKREYGSFFTVSSKQEQIEAL